MKRCSKCKQEKPIDDFYSGYRKCKKCISEDRKENLNYYRQLDKEKYQKNKEKIKPKKREYSKQYYAINKKEISIKLKKYRQKNRDKINKRSRDRKNVDIIFKMISNLRTRTSMAFSYKKWRKNGSTINLLGAPIEICKQHIELQFKEGMNWSNHTLKGWHIDHIIPLASAKDIKELEKLCHYTNLQPMWWRDNIIKGSKTP
jgi:hypothetical protein